MVTVGLGVTVTVKGDETHPVNVSVYVIVAVPFATAVTIPALVTVTILGLLLTQVPPVPGVANVVEPIQRTAVPIVTSGLGLTVTADVVEKHVVAELVNVKYANP